MSFWRGLFGGASARSVALVDIGSLSVGGAYLAMPPDAPPTVLYTARVPLAPHGGEPRIAAAGRALGELGERLVKEGAPILRAATGSGSPGIILVSVAPPWQEASVRTEHKSEERPFLFTKTLLGEMLRRSALPAEGSVTADESVLSVRLNGYIVPDPIGVRASEAEVEILVSSIEESVGERLARPLRNIFHSRDIRLVAAQAARYEALTALFPHEKDYLILDALSEPVAFTLVRSGYLAAVAEEESRHDPSAHTALAAHVFEKALGAIATHYPLPRSVFLLAEPEARDFLAGALAAEPMNLFWLSSEPPATIVVDAAGFSDRLKTGVHAAPDLALYLLALAAKARG